MVAIGPRRFDETEDASTGLGAGSGIGEQKILPRNGNRLATFSDWMLEIGKRPSSQQRCSCWVCVIRYDNASLVLAWATPSLCTWRAHAINCSQWSHGLRLASFILTFDG
jgi:hypothetical protein